MLKYLFGRVYTQDGEIDFGLAITHKRDSYAHSEMARDIELIPWMGGFVEMDKEGVLSNYHGESISCQVKTIERDIKDIEEITKDWNGYEIIFNDNTKPTVVVFIPEGHLLELKDNYRSVEKIDNKTKLSEAITNCINGNGWY